MKKLNLRLSDSPRSRRYSCKEGPDGFDFPACAFCHYRILPFLRLWDEITWHVELRTTSDFLFFSTATSDHECQPMTENFSACCNFHGLKEKLAFKERGSLGIRHTVINFPFTAAEGGRITASAPPLVEQYHLCPWSLFSANRNDNWSHASPLCHQKKIS